MSKLKKQVGRPPTDDAEKTYISFRASQLVKDQLAELAEKWGENQSRVIIRCIERVYREEIGK